MRRRKGVGSVISTIIIVMVLLFFFVIFLVTTTTASQKKLELNLNTADFLKTKNTVSILNRSLATTWYASTVQLIFKAGDESVGCGYDDFLSELKTDVTKKGYWYQYNDTTKQKLQEPRQFGQDQDGNPQKYNIRTRAGGLVEIQNPRICYPLDSHFKAFMEFKAKIYQDIATNIELNGVKLTLKMIGFKFFIEDGKVTSEATQKITMQTKNPFIDTETKNTNTVYTGFRAMMAGGRVIVDKAIQDSNGVAARSGDLLYTPQDTEQSYRQRVEAHLNANFASALPDGFAAPANNRIELRAGDRGEVSFQQDKQGLILHYDSDVKISERKELPGNAVCMSIRPDILAIIQRQIERALNEFGDDEKINLVSAIIQAESSQNIIAVSRCGAAGLMQLMPGTARGARITTIFEDASFTKCDETGYAARLRAAISGKSEDEIKSIDGRFDPEENIRAGIEYLDELELEFSRYTENKQDLMKLIMAAYNTGPENVKKAIARAKNSVPGFDEKDVKYDQIAQFLAVETRNYVAIVTSCTAYYAGGTAFTGSYNWPTPARKITQCFSPRTTDGKDEDHSGLDIAPPPSDVLAAADGVVAREPVNDCLPRSTQCSGGRLGNNIVIDHGNGVKTIYGHLKKDSILVSQGQTVSRGRKIAEIGNTGNVRGPTGLHLHFMVTEKEVPKNPCNYIKCAESTGLKCGGEVSPEILEGLYYYNDEKNDVFAPRPFSLNLKVEDNLNVLDCKPEGFRIYSWQIRGDTTCCGGTLWTCNLNPQLENIGDHGLTSGQKILNQDGSATACATTIDNIVPKTPDNPAPHTLGCEASGFTFVEI